jgi:hypothetical protein
MFGVSSRVLLVLGKVKILKSSDKQGERETVSILEKNRPNA